MKAITKAFKICGFVNTFIGGMLDQIFSAYKFFEEVETFINKYLHGQHDEFENVYTVFKCSNPSFSGIIER